MSSMGDQNIQPYAMSLPGSTSGAHRVLTRALFDSTEHATGPGKQTVSIGFQVAHAHQGLYKYLKLRQPHGADSIVLSHKAWRTHMLEHRENRRGQPPDTLSRSKWT